MEEELSKKFQAQDEKLDRIFKSVEKTRKYFLWTLIVTLATFLLPLIGFVIFIPQILSTYTSGLNF